MNRRSGFEGTRRTIFLAAVVALASLTACGQGATSPPAAPSGRARSFRMGFSALPPRNDLSLVPRVIDLWAPRADAAIIHTSVPWAELIQGLSPEVIVEATQVGLVRLFEQKNLPVTATLDVTDGLDRAGEAPALVAARRSVTEPAIQALYRRYAVAFYKRLRPEFMGLAAETNLIRAIGPKGVYASIVAMTNAAAAEIRSENPAARLYVSIQAEVAWGRPGPDFVGIDTDLADFPFANALGISSYPYLGGFARPEDVPADYYRRLPGARTLPLLVTEGGWPSSGPAGLDASADAQGRYLRRQAEIAETARVERLFQLSFTDLDASLAPQSPNLAFFTTLGLVDVDLRPKPSLAAWDEVFRRPRR